MDMRIGFMGTCFVLTEQEWKSALKKGKEKCSSLSSSVVSAVKPMVQKVNSSVKPVVFKVTKEVLAKTSIGLYHTANAIGAAGKKTAEMYSHVTTKEGADKVVDWMGQDVADLYDQAIAATVYLHDTKH